MRTSSALVGSDYTDPRQNITFSSGSANGFAICVNISLLDDSALEGGQTFTVVLTTSDPYVITTVNTTTVMITDSDG